MSDQQFIIQMFRRFAQVLQRAIPLTALAASCYLSFSIPQMKGEERPSRLQAAATHLLRKNHSRIKYVRDLADYVEKLLVRDRSIILFELTGDSFLDGQVIALAQHFVDEHQHDISTDFEFIFLEERHSLSEEKDEESYFILYGPNGEKLINIDNYINKNREKAHLKLNSKPLTKRLIESLNSYKEVGLDNISAELASIENDSNYVALLTAGHSYQTDKARKQLKAFEKEYQTKTKNVNKFVIKDEQTKRIFGLKSAEEGKVFLLVPQNKNLRPQFKQTAEFFTINGKRYANIEVSSAKLDEIFIFPPIQKPLRPSEFVLNVYINKNHNYEAIQSQIFEQLSKPEYKKYAKTLYYTSDVEEAAIYYEKNDYSSQCLAAYEKNTKLTPTEIRDILTHTFQYEHQLTKGLLDSRKLQNWLRDCEANKIEQHFQTEKPSDAWARQITGEQYKQIISQPVDKVIYHYSHHCHGCKKFGGKFEEFARNKCLNYPHLDFYRINNDENKAEGVRNYNSTPIFVFYKKGWLNPFIYKMPIFTEQLFDAFLRITSEVKLMPSAAFEEHIRQHSGAHRSVASLLEELRV